MKEILGKAKENHYAAGAFDCTSLESVMAITEAAEEMNAPVILQFAESHEHLIPLEVIGPIMVRMAEQSKVPTAVHLDHGTSLEICKKAAELGFNAVMIDASAKEYAENCALTCKVVEFAHKNNISVEAELGHIFTSKTGASEGDGRDYSEAEAYTDPQMARDFIEKTDVDALAIAFGTAHGIYTEKPKLDLLRISQIKAAKDIPYVMHGGSGLLEGEYHQAVANGICKINYYTYMSLSGGNAAAEYLKNNEEKNIYFESIARAGTEAMKQDVKKAIQLFGSAGRA